MTAGLKLAVIACPSLRFELAHVAAKCRAEMTIRHLDMALHERSADTLRHALQSAIDATTGCDAFAIAYGLCNRGIVGITARDIPLVFPRAHDCIGLLLGSTSRYLAELESEPGTYFQSAGWIAAARAVEQPQHPGEFTLGPNSNATFERLAARYGAEAARYLVDEMEGINRHYKRLAYIATPIAQTPSFAAEAQSIATARGLEYQLLDGDTGWLRRLVEGRWAVEEFLVVQPGQCVRLASGTGLIEAA